MTVKGRFARIVSMPRLSRFGRSCGVAGPRLMHSIEIINRPLRNQRYRIIIPQIPTPTVPFVALDDNVSPLRMDLRFRSNFSIRNRHRYETFFVIYICVEDIE